MRQAANVVKAFQDRFFMQGQLAILPAQASMYDSGQDIHAAGQAVVRSDSTAQLHKRLDALNADFDRAGRPENVGKHQATVTL